MKLYKNINWQEIVLNDENKNIPSDWSKDNVKNSIYLKARIGWQGLKSSEFIKDGIFYCVTGQDFENNEVNWNFCYKVTEDRYTQDKKIQLQKNDILITKDGTIGKFAKVTNIPYGYMATLNSGVFVSRAQTINQEFWFFILKSDLFFDFVSKQKSGSTIAHLNQGKFECLEFLVPSPEEQMEIAKILSKQESIINKTKKLISSIEKRNKFMIDELLSGNLRVKNNEDNIVFYRNKKEDWKSITLNSEKINIPNEWNKCNLGSESIPFVKSGVKKYEGIIDYYATGEVDDFSLGIKPTGSFTYDKKPSRANVKVLNNAIYLARMKNTLKILKFEKAEKFLLSTGFLGLQPNTEKVSLDYLYYTLISDNFQKIKNKECKGATQETLSDGAAEKIEILVPSIGEQKLIASSLKNMFNEVEKYKQILEKEEKTFTFLLEELMSGRLRIKI